MINSSQKLLMARAGAIPVDRSWDISYASYDSAGAGYFGLSSQEISPEGLFFKPDGTKMYVVGSSGDDVNEYTLSTAWDISTASYVQNFSVATQDTTPRDLFFKDDGTKMYVLGDSGDVVNEYTLSTAWDISTASYAQNFSVATEETNPTGLSFKGDGTKMYVIGQVGDDVNEYSLSTAWDISTASYVQAFSIVTEDSIPEGLFFKPDGTKMYILGASGNDVNEYTLSTAWDVSTASFVQNFGVGVQETSPRGVFFKSDGTKMYITGTSSDSAWSYSLSTAWDVSTASWDGPSKNYFSVSSQDDIPVGISFKPDGTKMYITGDRNNLVYEYDLSTAWDISTASYLQSSTTAGSNTPFGLYFKPDGTKMYTINYLTDDVYEIDLSTAWDVSTTAINSSIDLSAFEGFPSAVYLKPDGTKMYVCGYDGDEVNEFDLSTAWDVTTASHVQAFSVATQDGTPFGIFFKPDGTKMYIAGDNNNSIFEYDLSTAWDISTASYLQSFSISSQETNIRGVYFKPDGTGFYIVGDKSNAVHQYNIG